LLQEYRLTSINPSTAYQWLIKLGFIYETRRKGYFVDGHEKPGMIEYRKQFVTRYLQYERHAHRWIQISVLEAQELEQRGFIKADSRYR
jgi:DNA-binding transcriptional regulator YhcF (GntR family)